MSNYYDRCPNCMNPYDGSGQLCPYCGQDVMGYVEPQNCLPPFTILQNKYMIGRVLGQGGFGITYIGYDMNLATYVAIKEYYPESISTRGLAGNTLMVTAQSGKEEIYNKNLDRFVGEARNLSKFYGLPGIVSVRNFFYENGTAYIVMDYVAGDNLKKYLADNGGQIDETTMLTLMKPVLESLYEIHKQGLIHRDISPDNIMFDADGTIKLIDFGAVRGSSADMDMTYTVMLKHGYAPQEQYYTKGNQGPWTDIYSLCATMYKMLTGVVPPNCIERMSEDTLIPPSQCGAIVSPGVDQALTKGLSVNIADRYQNIGELIKDLYGKDYTFMGDGQIGVKEAVAPAVNNGVESSKKNNKKFIGIITGAVAALLVIVLCVKTFVLGGDKDDKITTATATATDATISEATTEEVTTEAVVELDGEWSDFKFMVEGQCYQMPMAYNDWIAQGWVAEMDATLMPGEVKGIRCHNDKMTCSISVANYGTETVGLEGCHIISFFYSAEYYDTDKDCMVLFPKDVKICPKSYKKSSKIQEVVEKYGEPEKVNYTEFISVCQYSNEDGSYLLFYGDGDGYIYKVEYMCINTPEKMEQEAGAKVDVVPYNEAYEYPSATADRFDDIFCIDGVNYKIRGPVSQLIDNGWNLEVDSSYLEPCSASMAVLRKGDATIKVRIVNPTIFTLDVEQTRIDQFEIDANKCVGVEVIFPGGARLGGNSADITTLYSDIDIYKEDVVDGSLSQRITEYGVSDGSFTIYVTSKKSETEEDVYYITKYEYDRTLSASKANLENTNYIQGITVN